MQFFKNRQSAGQLLAEKLKSINADIVLGIPRGGVVVASAVAELLKLSLDIIVTRKIGAPSQSELALGALDRDGNIVWDEKLLQELRIMKQELREEIENQKIELQRRENLYRQGKDALDVEKKRVILVDDGMATGATALSAIKYLKRHGAKVILALPLASHEALDRVKNEVEELVVLEIPEYFQAVGQFYHEFEPVTDQEVIQLLNE